MAVMMVNDGDYGNNDFADGGHGGGKDNHDGDGLIYIILGSDNLDFHIFVCCLINLLEI